MLSLSLSPHRANHQRAYPFTGLLGLTEVSVHGVLRTALLEDNTPLDASSIVVRVACYEGDLSGPGGVSANVRRLYHVEEELWSAPSGSEYASLGDFERSFWLTIPVDARDEGAISALSFKSWRVWWLIEALVYVRPAPIFGSMLRKAHPLLLVNYAPPALRAPPIWRGPNERLLLCKASASSPVYGAGDLFALKLELRKRTAAPDLGIKRITVEIRRVVTRHGRSSGSRETSQDDLPPTPPYDEKTELLIASPAVSSSSSSGSDSYFPDVSTLAGKREETVLLSMIKEDVRFESDGRWNGSFQGHLPRNRTTYHYSVGETVDNSSFSIKCYVHVRITPSDRAYPILEMAPTEFFLTPLSKPERDMAFANVKHVRIVQEAERKLFEPTEDGTGRMMQSKEKRSSVSSASAATLRRASDGEQETSVKRTRKRIHSTEEVVKPTVVRSASAALPRSNLVPAAPPLPKLSLPAFDRGRLIKNDGVYSRPAVSPVLEELTPKVSSMPSMLRRPFTPPDEEEQLILSTNELRDRFAGFNFKTSSIELSPPPSPTYPSSMASSRDTISTKATSPSMHMLGYKGMPPLPSPLSPNTATSRAIPVALQVDAPMISSRTLSIKATPMPLQPPLLRVQSADSGNDLGGRESSKGFRRFWRRASGSASASRP